MKAEWQRTTRVGPTIALHPALLKAVREYIDYHELQDAEAQALVCWQTESQRLKKAGLFARMAGAGNETVTQGVLVTPTRLIWADFTEDREAMSHGELLAGLQVTDYEKSPAFGVIPDRGVEVSGVRMQQGRVGTLFFPIGEGPGGDRARTVFKEAVRAAHGEGPASGAAAPAASPTAAEE